MGSSNANLTVYLVDFGASVARVPEAREGTVIHGIAFRGVRDPRQCVLLPIQIARFEGRLEAREDLQIRFQRVLLPAAVVFVGVVRYGIAATFRHLFNIRVSICVGGVVVTSCSQNAPIVIQIYSHFMFSYNTCPTRTSPRTSNEKDSAQIFRPL